jgi:hypothetical protein
VIAIAAFLLAVIIAIGLSPIHRWTWPWQRVYVREARRSDARLRTILGGPFEPVAAEAWLAASPDAPAADRLVILGTLGRVEDADRLIPTLPTNTPLDRFRKAYAEAFHRWRSTGTLDMRPVADHLADLDPDERESAAATVAFWGGVALVDTDHELRDVPPPDGPPLAARDELRLWRQRMWPLRWFLGMFLVTWIGLGLLGLLVET